MLKMGVVHVFIFCCLGLDTDEVNSVLQAQCQGLNSYQCLEK